MRHFPIPEEFNEDEFMVDLQDNKHIDMKSNFLSLNGKDVLGAVVSAVLVAVIGYVLQVGDVFAVEGRTILNTGVMAGLGSLLKALLTTPEGDFIGLLPVK